MNLRQAMKDFLQGWQSDLNAEWRETLTGVVPRLDAIPTNFTLESGETIFPGRKGQPPPGARDDSYVFRALDDLRLQDVNAVVLGQDPYPKVTRATGRSFEQGDLPAWVNEKSKVAESLRRILQSVAQFRTGSDRYVHGDAAWADVVRDIDSADLQIAQPRAFFDEWQSQGILCLNAGLTLSRFQADVQHAHFALWSPIVQRIFAALVTRKNHPIVFLLWGGVAATTFNQLGIQQAAQNAGTAGKLATVRHPHPGAEDTRGKPMFFGSNTFTDANEALIAIGGEPLEW